MATIVCVGIAAALMAAVARQAVLGRQALDLDRYRAQAEWLLQSAADHAAARLQTDPDWRGEVWVISAEEMAGGHGAWVEIVAEAPGGPGRSRRVRIVAEYPAESVYKARKSGEFLVVSDR